MEDFNNSGLFLPLKKFVCDCKHITKSFFQKNQCCSTGPNILSYSGKKDTHKFVGKRILMPSLSQISN